MFLLNYGFDMEKQYTASVYGNAIWAYLQKIMPQISCRRSGSSYMTLKYIHCVQPFGNRCHKYVKKNILLWMSISDASTESQDSKKIIQLDEANIEMDCENSGSEDDDSN